MMEYVANNLNEEGEKTKDITVSLVTEGDNLNPTYLVTISNQQYKMSFIDGKIFVDKMYSLGINSSNYKMFLKENGELNLPTTFLGNGSYSTVDGRRYKITSLYLRNLEEINGLILPETITKLYYDACWNTNIEYVKYKDKIYYTDRDLEANEEGLDCRRSFEDTPMYLHTIDVNKDIINNYGLYDEETQTINIQHRFKYNKRQFEVNKISAYAFNNTNAKHIIIGDGITTVKDVPTACGNFYQNPELLSITFGKDVSVIETTYFVRNPKLEEFIVDNGNLVYSSVNGILYKNNETELINVPLKNKNIDNHFVIPSSVKTLGDDSMRECLQITELTLPDNLQSVGSYTFYGMYNLKKVHYKGNTYTKYQDLENAFTENGVTYNYYSCLSNTGLK